LGTALLLWARHSGGYAMGLNAAAVMTAMVLTIYPAFVISRQLLLWRLRPILSTLRPTHERITNLEESEAIRSQADRSIVTPISPARRRILRIATVVALAATLGAMIARAIDVYEPNQSKLLTLYQANANLPGLLNVASIVAFGFLIVIFGRTSSRR